MEELQVVDPDDHSDQKYWPAVNCRSIIDTSRPFRSVKEAVAVFGERFLVGEIYTPKPFSFPKKETPISFSPSASTEKQSDWKYMDNAVSSVKKLEAELEDTKAELKLLEERESETEAALASLNAELHNYMSKLAPPAEVEVAADHGGGMRIIRDQEALEIKKRDAYLNGGPKPCLPSLAQILSIGEKEAGLFVGRKEVERRVMKKKPIVPLVGDLFSRKKGTSHNMHLLTSTGIDYNMY